MQPLKTKQQRADEQKTSNARERQIAKQYLQNGPSIQNLYNAFTHWYNSVPFLGGQPETGNVYITGTPPAVGIKNLEKVYKVAKVAGELNKAISKRVTGMQNNIQPAIRTKKGFVQYAKNKLRSRKYNANWQGDAVQLTKNRLNDGGFERLQSAHNENVIDPGKVDLQTANPLFLKKEELPLIYSPEKRAELLATNVNEVPSWYATGNPNHIGVSNSQLGPVLYSDRPVQYLGRQASSDIAAHEFSHYVYEPSNPIPREFFTPVEGYTRYFTKGRSAEVAARGTQIKNYFGLKEGEPLTLEHLKYAAKHFVKDRGYDNGMTQFFQSIKNWDQTAKWLTKNAPGYVIGGYVGNTSLNNFDQ